MKQAKTRIRSRRPSIRLGSGLGLLLLVGLLFASQAAASFERVGGFIESGNFQLAVPTGIAVNTTGNGGVPVGTIYTVEEGETPLEPYSGVVSYDAQGNLRQAWGWGVGNRAEEFQRCGPAGDPAFPTCPSTNFGRAGEGSGQIWSPKGVAVDQATGDVYVYNFGREKGVVQIFSATGEPIGSFGENVRSSFASEFESIDESPEKIHNVGFLKNMIAVDESGTVYISDLSVKAGGEGSRIMVFKPRNPGEYAHYEYTGRANDIDAAESTAANSPEALAVDSDGDLYASSSEFIREYSPSEPAAPICSYKPPGGQVGGLTVNAKRGEVFYVSKTNEKFHQIACGAGGTFVEKSSFPLPTGRPPGGILAFDPNLAQAESRPVGILYYASRLRGVDIFAPSEIRRPRVESESVSAVGTSSAALDAQIDPEGSQTSYLFQYLPQGAYEANEPDGEQSLTVSATSGVLGLGLGGSSRYGGEGTVTLGSGSTAATSLKTASGTATLKGAAGTATLGAAQGTGTVISGSSTVTSLTTSEGTFAVGQVISGEGIAKNTTVKTVAAGSLTLSAPAVGSAAGVSLSAGSTVLTSLTTSEGAFEVGQTVTGTGIPAGATIVAAKAGQLTISAPATNPGSGVAIKAGSNALTSVTTSQGAFEAGQSIQGTGIPAGTKIVSVEGPKLTLSAPITTPGVGVSITSSGPGPFAVGQTIEGPGIPAGTKILAAKAGELTLSNQASSSGTVTIHAGLPFDASAVQVREALEALPAIGVGNVRVSGGPGDETGSTPYLIRFTGALENVKIETAIKTDASGLSGGSASAAVQVENVGGGGFQGATESPSGGAVLGSGQQALSAGTTLTGLEPGAAYLFRVIASSPCNPEEEQVPCEAVGAPRSFHTFAVGAAGLPDHRAYEMVSPVAKAGGQVYLLSPHQASGPQGSCTECNQNEFSVFPKESSPDGEAVVFEGNPFSGEGSATKENEYLSRRTPEGWQTTNLTPERLGYVGGENGFKAFDEGLDEGVLIQPKGAPSLSPDAPTDYSNLYAFPSADPASLIPTVRTPGFRSAAEFEPIYAGSTPDLSHVLFEANDALTPATPVAPEALDGGPTKENLYESVGGALRLVNVMPGNAETVPGSVFGSGALINPGTELQNDFDDAISADGSRIFWSTPSGQVYVREDGVRTIEIPDHTGKFITASVDGSEVLLSDGVVYDLETETETNLTEEKGGFQGLVGRSEDLSSIYFVDTAVLDETANGRGEVAKAGGFNLYLYRDGHTRFIATLEKEDNAINGGFNVGDWRTVAAFRSAEASPGGRYLAFMSRARLTGVESNGLCSVENATGKPIQSRCEEIFLYDSQTGELSCPSCNPNGRAPLGNSALPLSDALSAGYVPPRIYQTQTRYLTDSGRLYFDSHDSLTALDTNEGAEDVYQYEPGGVGTCAEQGGCVNLISSGRERFDSNFLAINEGGDGAEAGADVFFTTREKLVPKDVDDLVDLYDAREGGGFTSESEPRRPACTGETCQSASTPAPAETAPGSSQRSGEAPAEQTTTKTCPKGKVRKGGKCVAKPKPKKSKKHNHKKKSGRTTGDKHGGAK